MMRAWSSKMGLVVGAVLITLLVLESVVRVAFPQQLIRLRPDMYQSVDDGLQYVLRANLDTIVNTGERDVRLLTDDYGHRVGDNDDAACDVRILALGDSFVAALQVDFTETMSAQLATALSSADEGVCITNTGVDGYNPNHYRMVAQREYAQQAYDFTLVFIYMGNDVVDHQTTGYAPYQPIERHALRWPASPTLDEIIDAWLYPINDFLEVRSHLFVLMRSAGRNLTRQLRDAPFQFPLVLRQDHAEHPMWEITVDILADLERASPTPVLFVLLPQPYEVYPDEMRVGLSLAGLSEADVNIDQPRTILMQLMTERALTVMDLTPVFREASNEVALYGRVDKHFSPAGHDIASEALLPKMDCILNSSDEHCIHALGGT